MLWRPPVSSVQSYMNVPQASWSVTTAWWYMQTDKPESKTAAKKRRRAEAAAAVQADIQAHGTWQPVQPQAASNSTTKGHPVPALKGRRAQQDTLSTIKAATGSINSVGRRQGPFKPSPAGLPNGSHITAVQPPHGSQPDCIQTKPKGNRTWNSILLGPATAAAASAATVNTNEWPALGDV